MRSIPLLLLAVLVAVLSGCPVNAVRTNGPQARTVQGGTRTQVAYFYNLTDNCQPEGVPQVTVTRAPANGTVTIGAGNDLPQYPSDNPRAVCNQAPVPTSQVYYESNGGFRGADSFAIQVQFSGTFTQTYTYELTVN
ncbi:MAG: hypothetical protein JSS29_00990 [Proteobacteria bacterium]|nr:hypothetical protein [Pseudomonadota bacterium]